MRLRDRRSYRDVHAVRELFGLEPVEAEVIQLHDKTRHAR